jgi:hypothetical protein
VEALVILVVLHHLADYLLVAAVAVQEAPLLLPYQVLVAVVVALLVEIRKQEPQVFTVLLAEHLYLPIFLVYQEVVAQAVAEIKVIQMFHLAVLDFQEAAEAAQIELQQLVHQVVMDFIAAVVAVVVGTVDLAVLVVQVLLLLAVLQFLLLVVAQVS